MAEARCGRGHRARPRVGWALGVGLLAWAPGSQAAVEPEPDAAAAREAGLLAYGDERYDEAMRHFQRAYELGGEPADLYGWAQAARNAGDCATAIELYRRFVDLGMEGDSRVAAEQNEARCRELLAEQPEPAPAPAPAVPGDVPPPEIVPIHDAPAPARRTPDALGVTLATVGGAATVAGGVLLSVGEAQRIAQSRVTDYARFDELDPRIDRLYLAGGIVLGVGVALIVAGTIRLVQTRRRRSPSAAWRRDPWGRPPRAWGRR